MAIAAGSCPATVKEEACDADWGSQDAETEGHYSAIQLEVVNNWGNEAFQCLYRVRVHGELEMWYVHTCWMISSKNTYFYSVSCCC